MNKHTCLALRAACMPGLLGAITICAVLFASSAAAPHASAQERPGHDLADRLARDGEIDTAGGNQREGFGLPGSALSDAERRTRSGAAASRILDGPGADTPGADTSGVGSVPPAPAPEAVDAATTTRPPPATPALEDIVRRTREQVLNAEVESRIEEARRKVELDQVADSLRQAREAAEQASARAGESAGAGAAVPPDLTPAEQPLPSVPAMRTVYPGDTHATVLLVLQPGRRGIRRVNKLADPVLCVRETCYISRGSDQDAVVMSRGRTFGTRNTLGRRAGACRSSLGCVFRNVDLGSPAEWVQPVDLRLIRHDRRQPTRVMLDPTCAERDGVVTCNRGYSAPDYQLWVVPERLAQRVAARALTAAVEAGLPSMRPRPASAP